MIHQKIKIWERIERTTIEEEGFQPTMETYILSGDNSNLSTYCRMDQTLFRVAGRKFFILEEMK